MNKDGGAISPIEFEQSPPALYAFSDKSDEKRDSLSDKQDFERKTQNYEPENLNDSPQYIPKPRPFEKPIVSQSKEKTTIKQDIPDFEPADEPIVFSETFKKHFGHLSRNKPSTASVEAENVTELEVKEPEQIAPEPSDNLHGLQREIKDLRNELAVAKSETSLIGDLENIEEIAVLQIELDGAKSKIAHESERTKILEVKMLELEKGKSELQSLLEEKDSALSSLQMRIEEMAQRNKILEQELSDEQSRSKIQGENIVVLEKMIESMDSDLSQTQHLLDLSTAAPNEDGNSQMMVRMLEDELVRVKDELAEANAKLAEPEKDAIAMVSQLEEALVMEKIKVQKLEGMVQSNETVEQEFIKTLEQLDQAEARLAKESTAVTTEDLQLPDASQAKLEEATATISDLEDRLRESHEEIVVKTQILADLEETLSYERSHSNTVQSTISELENRICSLQENDQVISAEMKKLEQLLDEKNKELEALETKKSDLSARLIEKDQTFIIKDQIISALQLESATLVKTIDSERENVVKLEREMALTSDNHEAEISKLEGELASANSTISDLNAKISALEHADTEHSTLQTQLKEAQERFNLLQLDLSSAQKTVEDMKINEKENLENFSKFENSIEQLNGELAEKTKFIDDLERELAEALKSADDKVDELSEQIKCKNQEIADLTDKLCKYEVDLNELQANFAEQAEELEIIVENFDHSSMELKEKWDALMVKENELDAAKSEIETLKKIVDDLQSQISSLEDTIQTKNTLLEDLESSSSSASDLVAEKDDQIYKLESELALLAQSKVALAKLEKNLGSKDRKISELEMLMEGLEEELAESRLQMTASQSCWEAEKARLDSQITDIQSGLELSVEKDAVIEDLRTKLSENSSKLENLLELQEKIEALCTSMENDRLAVLEKSTEKSLASVELLKSTLSELDTRTKNIKYEMESTADKDVIIEDLKAKFSENSSKLEHLSELQAKIETICASIENDRLALLEKSSEKYIVSADLLKSTLSDLETKTRHNSLHLGNLEKLQSNIDNACKNIDDNRIHSLEERYSKIETLLKNTDSFLIELKEKAETKKKQTIEANDEQRMILAAWHDLGLKIMKMKSLEKS